MDLSAIVRKGVALAFNKGSSLTLPVTLNFKSGISFNFTSGHPEVLTESTKSVFAFELKGDRTDKFGNSTNRQMLHKTLLFKTDDVGNLSLHESAIINSKVWQLGSVTDFDKNITTVEIFREASDV